MIIPPKHMKGLCCLAFPLPFSPEQLEEFAEAERAGTPLRKFNDKISKLVKSIEYLGIRTCNQITGESWNRYKEGGFHTYRCIYLTKKGKCSRRKSRFHMCKSYNNCEYPDYCESTYCSCHPEQRKETYCVKS